MHVAGLALTLVGGAGALGLRMLGDASPLTVDEALERFRASASASASASTAPTDAPSVRPGATATPGVPGPSASASARPVTPGATGTAAAPGRTAAPTATATPAGSMLPPEGVYVYATTGYETGDAGPAHARHDYPERTTLTVRRDGCGSSMKWEPVENRWDDVIDCVDGRGSRIRVYDTFHEFFGVQERHRYVCSGDSWFRPPTTRIGFRWEFDCVAEGARTHTEARIVGVERVTTDAGTADALHVRFDTTMSGRTEGTNPMDYWLALDGPYLLRKTGSVDAQVHTGFGTLDYHEEYDVRLTSRTPRT